MSGSAVRLGEVGLLPFPYDFDFLSSFKVYSDIVAVSHLEENMVSIGVLGTGYQEPLENLARLGSYPEKTAYSSTRLFQMVEDFTVITFQFSFQEG